MVTAFDEIVVVVVAAATVVVVVTPPAADRCELTAGFCAPACVTEDAMLRLHDPCASGHAVVVEAAAFVVVTAAEAPCPASFAGAEAA